MQLDWLVGSRIKTTRPGLVLLRNRSIAMWAMLALILAVPGCGTESDRSDLSGVTVSDGFAVDVISDGLVGPTQFVQLDDSTLLVATINGPENDELGQVLRVDLNDGTTEVVRDQLDKPTGLALVDDELWVMERNRLTRSRPGEEPIVVADDLPNNGRSQGTLTVTPDGQILFNTSGTLDRATNGDDPVVAGSGRLFTVDPSENPGQPTEVASGFKHAYAHTFLDGRLITTEMSDGSFDGLPAADEVVEVVEGEDHGWPWCVGANRPVAEFGGSELRCRSVPPSLAVFEPGATPTSIAASPFAAGDLLVALWVEGRVVSIDGDSFTPSPTEIVSGLAGPQHMVVVGDSILLSEFGAGRILRITLQ